MSSLIKGRHFESNNFFQGISKSQTMWTSSNGIVNIMDVETGNWVESNDWRKLQHHREWQEEGKGATVTQQQ